MLQSVPAAQSRQNERIALENEPAHRGDRSPVEPLGPVRR